MVKKKSQRQWKHFLPLTPPVFSLGTLHHSQSHPVTQRRGARQHHSARISEPGGWASSIALIIGWAAVSGSGLWLSLSPSPGGRAKSQLSMCWLLPAERRMCFLCLQSLVNKQVSGPADSGGRWPLACEIASFVTNYSIDPPLHQPCRPIPSSHCHTVCLGFSELSTAAGPPTSPPGHPPGTNCMRTCSGPSILSLPAWSLYSLS